MVFGSYHIFRYSVLMVLFSIVFMSILFYAFAPDRSLVPAEVRSAILQEYSGELAQRHVEFLSVNRNRQAEEYLGTFLETDYLVEHAEQYGLSDVQVDMFPSGRIWDAEKAELWLIQPVRKKIASLNQIPASLASGSISSNIESEVIDIGSGNEADYEGKDVEGKIIFGNASVDRLFQSAVVHRGAAGVLGTGSWGVGIDTPGYSLDQIGWQRVSPLKDGGGFGFVLSKRQYEEIRNYFDKGQKVVMRAHVSTTTYPYTMNVISATIPGTGEVEGEFLISAHVFERIGTPGAHDNTSGVGVTLEISRTLTTLIDRGVLDQPKRTIRFLWIPEHAGTRAFMYKYPNLQHELLAAINFDMAGPDLELTDSYLRMKLTPDSRPSYLNDLIRDLLRITDQTNITTQWGNNSPFNYRVVPFISGSDHIQFLYAGIPSIQFGHWNDNFYHTSDDRSRFTDPTELKRVGFMGASAVYYLAQAGAEEAKDLAWESAANGDKWIAEVTRQSIRLLENGQIHEQYKSAQNKVYWAANRAITSVRSVFDLSQNESVQNQVEILVRGLDQTRDNHIARLNYIYREKCKVLDEQPRNISLTEEEKKLARLIPSYKYPYYSEEYRSSSNAVNQFLPNGSTRLSSLALFEIPNFIDGERNMLDIYNAVRAEYGNVTTDNYEWKYAYEITPETEDISMESVEGYINAMEQAGLIEVERK